MYDFYPATYTASPAELRRWEAQGADHGVDDVQKKHLEMVDHALNAREQVAAPARPYVDAMVVKLSGVKVEM